MSIATFESPQVSSQRFFPWVLENEAANGFSDSDSPQSFEADAEIVYQPALAALTPSRPEDKQLWQPPEKANEMRLGMPVRLGAVMLKLLKSYGITDEEIAEGVAAYAAKSRLVQAG